MKIQWVPFGRNSVDVCSCKHIPISCQFLRLRRLISRSQAIALTGENSKNPKELEGRRRRRMLQNLHYTGKRESTQRMDGLIKRQLACRQCSCFFNMAMKSLLADRRTPGENAVRCLFLMIWRKCMTEAASTNQMDCSLRVTIWEKRSALLAIKNHLTGLEIERIRSLRISHCTEAAGMQVLTSAHSPFDFKENFSSHHRHGRGQAT
ncbi:hypothetical protein ACLOJK_030364 [Asimina triloba]